MLKQNEIWEALVTDYTAEGQGVAHVEGCAVFIPNAIVGERVRIRIEKGKKTWASAKIVEILEKSPHRTQRQCPISAACGGCDFWHMDYAEECRLKGERVRCALNRIGGENLEEVPIVPAPSIYGYRNKAIYSVGERDGRVIAGFYRAGSHAIMEQARCQILPPEFDQIKDIVLCYVNQYHIPAYRESDQSGLLRHIFIRKGWVSGEILVCLVIHGRHIPEPEALIGALQAVPGFATLTLSVNTKPGNVVLGEEEIVLWGEGFIGDTLCGLDFRLSPRSFYQVNHPQAQRLYAAAIALAGLTKQDTVLDLYCGVGTITLAMAKFAGRAIGVEVIPQAVADARENALRNGAGNAEFFCADAGQAALALEEQGLRPKAIVVDPPRKGLSADAIAAIARMSPQRLVYVSCDPGTLARDIALLKPQGFTLQSAQAFDLFPRTKHVETVVQLSQQKPDDVIRVGLDLDELDITAADK